MKKRFPMSALLTGLIAAPVIGGAPAPAEARSTAPGGLVVPAPVEAFPAEMPPEVAQRMRRWARGGRLDAHGMQNLQRQLAQNAQERIDAFLNGSIPAAADLNSAWKPVQVLHADVVTLNLTPEKVSFLGISTSPVDPILGQQLELPPGMGLLIDYVVKNSPAEAGGLQVHDVLKKLDDQLLVNAEQLRVLVRAKKPGESVALTVIRGGKALALSTKLGEKELTVAEQMQLNNPQMIFSNPGVPAGMTLLPPPDQSSDHLLSQNRVSTSIVLNNDGGTTRTMIDDQNDITLRRSADGKQTLTVKDRQDHTLYEGSADDLAKAGLTPEVVKKVEQLRESPNQVIIRLNNGRGAGGAQELHTNSLTMSRADDHHQITLKIDGAGRSVTVKELPEGKVIYQGAASDDDLKAMSSDVAAKVRALLDKAK